VGAPAAPRIFNETETSVEVEIEPVSGAVSYTLQVSSPASARKFERLVPLEIGKVKTKVETLTPGIAHAFKVVAKSAAGKETDPSAASEGTTKMFPAPLPGVQDITDDGATIRVPVSTHPLPAGTRYKVQILDPDDVKGGWGPDQRLNQDATVSAPSGNSPALVDIGELEPGHTYEVRLIAVSPEGVESEPSMPVSFTTGQETTKSRIALVTGGNTPAGVEIVKDICAVDSNFGRYDVVFVCIREGGDSLSAHELKDMAEQSQQGSDIQIVLVNYDKKNSESVKEAAKMLKANKIHLIVNNAKLKREQLALLIGNQ
jgi:hypothetical protein